MFNKMKEKERTKLAAALIILPWALFILTFLLMIPIHATLNSLAKGGEVGLMLIPIAHAANSIAYSNMLETDQGYGLFCLGIFLLGVNWLSFAVAIICTPIGIYILSTPGDDEKAYHSGKKS